MLVFKRGKKVQVGREDLTIDQTHDINLGKNTTFNYRGTLLLQKQYLEASWKLEHSDVDFCQHAHMRPCMGRHTLIHSRLNPPEVKLKCQFNRKDLEM